MQRTLGLRWLLVVLVVLAVLPGFIVVMLASFAEQREQLDRARAELESTTRLVVSSQEQLVDGVHRALIALGAMPALRRAEFGAMCTEYMSTLQGKFQDFSSFGMLDMTGHMVCQADGNTAPAYAGDRLFYRRAIDTGQFAIGDFIVGRVNGLPIIVFGLPVRDADGASRGVVFASLDLARADNRFKAMPLPAGIRVSICDVNAKMLLSNAGGAEHIGQPVAPMPLRNAILEKRSGGFEASDERGAAWLHHVQAIGDAGGESIFVAVSRPRADAMAAAVHRERVQLLLLSVATLLGIAIAWLLGNHVVAGPLQRLLARMQEVERGEPVAVPAARAVATPLTTEFIALDDALTATRDRLLQRDRERGEMLQRLLVEQERLADAQRLGRIVNWVYEVPARQLTWSANAGTVLGFEAPTGRDALARFLAHVHPQDLLQVESACAALAAGRDDDAGREHRIIRDDGSIGWLFSRGECERDAEGRTLYLFGMMQDITASKNAAATTALLQSAIAHLNDAVLITDAQREGAAANAIVFVNAAFERHTGYAREQVLGRNPRFLQGPHTDPAPIARIRSAMASWQPVQVEMLNYTRDSTAFWVELNIQPIADDAGLITHWVSIQRDVTRRRHAEEALRSNEARLATATDAARLGIFETDLPSGRITWTGYHEAMWGYAPGEFDGTFAMFEQRIHPQDRAKVVAEVEASRQHGSLFVREYRVVWPDDSVHWVLVHGRHVLDAYGQPTRAYGVAMDVTDRMLAQQRIEQANQRIGTLLQTMTIGFLTIDRQWRFTYVNPRGSKLMGRDAAWLQGRHYFDAYPPDTSFVAGIHRALDEQVASHVEGRDPNTGHWFEADVYPSEEGASLFFRDITRRKRTEEETQALVQRLQALREMDGALLQALSFDEIGRLGASRMRALTNAWGVFITQIDQAAGVVQMISCDAPFDAPAPREPSPLAEWYTTDELASMGRGEPQHVLDLDPSDRGAATLPPAVHGIAKAGQRAYLRVPMRVEGTMIGAVSLWKAEAEPFPEAQIQLSLAIAGRIAIAFQQAALRSQIELNTQQLEQRVAERTAEVEAANKELEAFSYSVSHDLRAPLQAIDGFSRALAERHATQIGERGRHYLDRIRAGTLQMATLIDDLISLARVSRADLRRDAIDLAEIARGIVERLRAAAPERHVRIDIQSPLPAQGDHRLVGVLLVNLLDNAWKFSSRTSAARIEVGATTNAAGQTEYFVADNGVGFDMDYADKLFGAFQRLHSTSEFPGSGIGLATVQRIAMRHGGTVSAESVPGVRTVIRFTLAPALNPVWPAVAAPVASADEPASAKP